RAQGREVLHVFVHVLRFGSFQAARMVSESRVRHQGTKPSESDLATANMFMAIDTGTKRGFGIIQVERYNLVQANRRFDLPQWSFPPFSRAYIVTSGKQMGGVQTNTQTLRLFDLIINCGEVLHSIAET